MKTINLILLFVSGILSMSAQTPVHPPAMGNWIVSFADEFNQDALNLDIWNVEHGNYNTLGDSKRDSANVKVEDGELRIYMLKQTDENAPRQRWTCGYIYTKEMFGRNVYIEARMKAVRASGVNSAFWMVSRAKMATAYSDRYEIDINEIQYDINRQQFAARSGWHDWKTYGYATDINGNQVDNGLGAMKYYAEDDYQIWGLWLNGNDFHFYLNGEEVWNGKTHAIYSNQWDTGVGQINPWATDEEQRAYGKYGQDDWNYMGGYTGELMHIAFSNMLMAFNWTPETDEADGQYMAIDWVRSFVPEKEMDRNPIVLLPNTMQLAKGSHKITLDKEIDLNLTANHYLNYWLDNPDDSNFQVRLLDEANNVVSSLTYNSDTDYVLAAGSKQTSSQSVYPYSFYLRPQATSKRLFVTRITASQNLADAISVKLYNDYESVSDLEPFFYPNVDETGQTSINNQWSLNAKGTFNAKIKAIEFENYSDQKIEISNVRQGDNFLSVIANEEQLPYADTHDIILRSANIADSIVFDVRSKSAASISLSVNSTDTETLSWAGGENGILKEYVSPDKTTTYQLTSIENESGKRALNGKSIVYVPSNEDVVLYPSFDTYIQENQALKDLSANQNLVLKTDRMYNRLGYLEFDVPANLNEDQHAYLFLSLREVIAPLFPVEITMTTVETEFPKPMYWNDRPHWKTETEIGKITINNNNLRAYGFDISDALRNAISEGRKKLSICLSLTGGERSSMVTFQQYVSSKKSTSPRIYIQQPKKTSINEIKTEMPSAFIYPNPAKDYFYVQGNDFSEVQIMNLWGAVLKSEGVLDRYDISDLKPGIYLFKLCLTDGSCHTTKVFVK
ncbi:T9SS type A sorting domain-containing protein [Dysgonomonas sp. 520]|uniref:T9SS type A sorting domain-containing protein n=1 Tax=Dysgonomonas sp. 520 TaxID=2302931 RepID=UPI0013D51DA9|nr:T9SS type A sorting domain-containing protein [Dysgonomonas sp. 520]NDW08725.1 T9SS C-terminal target domain-containing protein [Dysgonomonas sp. 520]